MTSTDVKEASPALSPEAAEDMAKYGITRVPIDCFHYGDFRYTNLEDAVAQAKRKQRPEDSRPAISAENTGDMAKYGISRIPVDHFHYGKYRYTNLEHAVAEAKREQSSS
jgi:hypothetical protein